MSYHESITLIVFLGSDRAGVLVQTNVLDDDPEIMEIYLERLERMGEETAGYLSGLLATRSAEELTTLVIEDEAARHFQRQLTVAVEPYSSWQITHKNVGACWKMTAHGTKHGFRLAVHAIGDNANHLVLETLKNGPKPLPGSSIEHAQLLDFDDLPLFRQLGLIASIQPTHLVDDRELCHKFWPGREHRAYPFKAIVEAGVPIKLGSDCPIAPLHPREAMAVAISRAGVGEQPFCAEQTIDLLTAWTASTSSGKAGLDQGDVADVCVYASDPLSADAEGLRAMDVLGTMLGGRWTFRTAALGLDSRGGCDGNEIELS